MMVRKREIRAYNKIGISETWPKPNRICSLTQQNFAFTILGKATYSDRPFPEEDPLHHMKIQEVSA